jgi:adhesin/invasin
MVSLREVAVLAGTSAVVVAMGAIPAVADSISYTDPAAGPQSFRVPAGVCAVTVDARGAQGGRSGDSGDPAPGGRVVATVPVTPGETLLVNVGGRGGDAQEDIGPGDAAAIRDTRNIGVGGDVSVAALAAGGAGGAGGFSGPGFGLGGVGGGTPGGDGDGEGGPTPEPPLRAATGGQAGTASAGGLGGIGALGSRPATVR